MNIKIDEAAWSAKGLAFSKAGNFYSFPLPQWADPIIVPIVARINGAHIHLATDRSVEHRTLAQAIGADFDYTPPDEPTP